jgi:hypothetical protein
MDTQVVTPKPSLKRTVLRKRPGLKINMPVTDFKLMEIPGVQGRAKLGVCYVNVLDIPKALDGYMEVNPRVPSRSRKGILSGPVVKGILTTLREQPEQMALKNQGISLMVDSVEQPEYFEDVKASNVITLSLNDPTKHGIINGGHTYAAIMEAIEMASPEELQELKHAFVKIHIFQGIPAELIPDIAEGLNRSKQVDDPSLMNLQGQFDIIRRTMAGHQGEKAIAYHQGDEGDMYISDVLVYIAMMNPKRFNERKQPNNLYYKLALGLKYFNEDLASDRVTTLALIKKLPDFLWLSDSIRKLTPEAAKKTGFQFGRVKLGKDRAGNEKFKDTYLPFIDERVDYRVPNAWVYPMLSAFRANLDYNTETKQFTWKVPLEQILPEVIDNLVGVCVAEHRGNNNRPELVGKKESAYSQCFNKVQLYLARKNLLS